MIPHAHHPPIIPALLLGLTLAAPGPAQTLPARALAPAIPLPTAAGTPAASSSKLVTNIWVDTDVRQVIQDISSQTDTVIVCDQTVQGVVSMSVKDMSVSDCLERVCAIGGYSYTKVKDYYIVGRADPGTPLFQRLAAPERIRLSNITPDQARTLLHPSLAPYVTYDKASGTAVITAPDAMRRRIADAIHLIDQPNPQVAIEAVVFELSEDGSKQLALDWQFNTPHIAMQSQNLVNTFTYGAGSDLGTYVDLTLRAIVESQKGQVLANPKILVMNNANAEIFVGQEKYYTLLSGQASNPYYTLQSIKAGVQLNVTPFIGSDGHMTLALEPEVSDVVDDNGTTTTATQTVPGGATTSSPVVTRRHAKTVVDITDGQTIVLGGLIRDQHRAIIDKVPFAGDIPIAGAAFRRIREETIRQEVVILITAHIVDSARAKHDKLAPRLAQRYVTPLDAVSTPIQGPRP